MAGTGRRDEVDRHVEHWRAELPQLDPLHEAIVARLMRIHRHLASAREDASTTDGLPRSAFKILLTLRRMGPPYTSTPSELAERLGLSRGALSSRLAPLEDDGLITRTVDRDDRRRVHVRLTAAGSRAFAAQAGREGAQEASLLSALPRAGQEQLADLLRELVLRIDDPDA